MAKGHTIAIIANTSWNIYNFRRHLYKYLEQCGYEVVAMGSPDRYAGKLEKDGVRFVPLHTLVPSNVSWVSDMGFLRELYREIQALGPDLLLLFTAKPNIYGNTVASKLDIPTISTLTGIGSVYAVGGWRARGVSFLYRRALKKAGCVVFHNSDDLRLFRAKGIIESVAGMVISGSGIQTEEIDFCPLPRGTVRSVLLMSRMIEDKGIRTFMEASKRIVEECPNVQFTMIGNCPEGDKRTISRREIDRWAGHPQCVYYDFVEDVFPYIEKAHIVVLPSWREGLPRVILEAMAVGRPVVATDVPGCRQAVANGRTGMLVPPRDVPGLYEGLKDMLGRSEAELAEMGAAGRERVERLYTHAVIDREYLRIIRRLLSAPIQVEDKTM